MNYNLLSIYRLEPLKVKMLQLRKGIRNSDIARARGIHPVDISRHINGKARNPKIQQAIADELGVPLTSIAIKAPIARPGRRAA